MLKNNYNHLLKVRETVLVNGIKSHNYFFILSNGLIENSSRYEGLVLYPNHYGFRYTKFIASNIMMDFGEISFTELAEKYPEHLI